jgi:small subunit ribosomal protein S6
MIVLRADLQEAGVKEQIERLRKLLENNGATVAAMHEWGLRELAYEIRKERRGYYILAEYTGTAAAVAELERHLKLSDIVLRFVSVRQEHEVSPAPARFDEGTAEDLGKLEADDEEDARVEREAGELE